MNVIVAPSQMVGNLTAPASKSMLQRAIAAAYLCNSTVQIDGYSYSGDVHSALKLISALGVEITISNHSLYFNPVNHKTKASSLNIGESGLGIRLFAPILSLGEERTTINATGSLRKRPLKLVENVLNDMGVSCVTNNGFAPISVQGPLKGGEISFDSGEGSQLLSGLLMALPKAKENSQLTITNLKSKPYIDMTLELLSDFGININNRDYRRFDILGNQLFHKEKYLVEGDWSAAAFLLVGAAISGSLRLENIRMDSKQGDKNIVKVLKEVGAIVNQYPNHIMIKKNTLSPFTYDATETPDLFPPLAALATACKGVSRIKGLHRLEFKESNRANAIVDVFKRLKLKIAIDQDEMIIWGGHTTEGKVKSYQDHRMAMMSALIGLNSKKSIEISDAECIEKSYPNFFEDLKALGVEIYEN